MSPASIDFDAPDLAQRIEQLSQYDLDRLPFGVILLDREGIVKFYSEAEARQSGYNGSPIGLNFFNIARTSAGDDFRARILIAQEAGPVDLEFGWPMDYAAAKRRRELRVRVQSSGQGGFWLFIERDTERD